MEGTTYGYVRVSTHEQNEARQLAAMRKFGVEERNIVTEKLSGKDFNRPRYQMLKEEILESGDTLIVTELDRLGRNKKATLNELRFYQDNNIRVMVLELPTTLLPIEDMENSMAKMMLETINNMMIELYASMAQAELEKKEKRQREGIEAKKARGEWSDYGRPRVMPLNEFAKRYQAVERGEKRPFELMRELQMNKATFYRYKGLLKKEVD